jgi:transcriptional regulator with XRE-family HTH domain
MAIGPILREARLKKQLTESQVAKLTRMKVQIVEDLERDDFHRIAATIYGKGFIKLYAECVDLDPQPLIADYLHSVSGDTPSLIANGPAHKTDQDLPDNIKIKTVPVPENEPQAPAPQEESPEDLFVFSRKQRTIEDDSLQPTPPEEKGPSAKDEFIRKVREQTQQLTDRARETASQISDKLTKINWSEKPLKIVGLCIAVLIAALFLIIIIKGCTGGESSTNSRTLLERSIAPPEPYFD